MILWIALNLKEMSDKSLMKIDPSYNWSTQTLYFFQIPSMLFAFECWRCDCNSTPHMQCNDINVIQRPSCNGMMQIVSHQESVLPNNECFRTIAHWETHQKSMLTSTLPKVFICIIQMVIHQLDIYREHGRNTSVLFVQFWNVWTAD